MGLRIAGAKALIVALFSVGGCGLPGRFIFRGDSYLPAEQVVQVRVTDVNSGMSVSGTLVTASGMGAGKGPQLSKFDHEALDSNMKAGFNSSITGEDGIAEIAVRVNEPLYSKTLDDLVTGRWYGFKIRRDKDTEYLAVQMAPGKETEGASVVLRVLAIAPPHPKKDSEASSN